MSSTPEAATPVPAHHRQATNGGRLSLDDISQYFKLPIAEAASILGVCTSVLKRICRENGIVRWPYRKFLAGKTVEDIKKDAARQKSKELAASSNNAKQNSDLKMTATISAGMPSNLVNQVMNRTSDIAQGTSKSQQGMSMAGNAFQPQGYKILQHGMTTTTPSHQLRNIHTYMDEFKYGFPANGLSSASVKWWGTSNESANRNPTKKSATEQEEEQECCEYANETSGSMEIDDQTDHNTNESVTRAEPSTSLLSLRKRALEYTRESLQVGISDCMGYKLGKRQRLVLVQVFRSSLPDQWKDSLL
ncbi:uncharacterized protein M6B38_113515 [Iris pallida]|uniref:RWP-RK domain-containing protein n=1 Tax=Iris pallida TaxID=29817 RepID=A0AAX6IL13_IRIPA|nr:uncharacterized protein M6B38_113515 [Iris pallida]